MVMFSWMLSILSLLTLLSPPLMFNPNGTSYSLTPFYAPSLT
ncbi:hypothetical protein BpHYR1_026389, partial (mitochondrion) [Brachionus plicatilis]